MKKTANDYQLDIIDRKIERYRKAQAAPARENAEVRIRATAELPRLYLKRERLQKRQFEASIKRRAKLQAQKAAP